MFGNINIFTALPHLPIQLFNYLSPLNQMDHFKEQELNAEQINILTKNQKAFKNGTALSWMQLYLQVARQFTELEGKDYNKLGKDKKEEIMNVSV
jgi:hypothetical protein